MGYRSDVGCVIKVDKNCPDPDEVFREFIGKVKLIGDEFFNAFRADDYGWGDRRFVFFVSDVKWYEGYEEVKAFEAIWNLANETEGLSGFFVRIGEEYDDIETNCFGIDPPADEVYPVRSVCIEFESLLGKRRTDAQEQEAQGQADTPAHAD